MKILHMPNGSKENPYQKILKEFLEKEGLEINIENGDGFFKILKAFKRFKPCILHFHWIHVYTVSLLKKNIILSFIKGTIFLIQIFYLKLFKKIKIVYTVHNLLNHERIHFLWEFIINFIAIRFFDDYIVHCEEAKALFIKKYKISKNKISKIHVIPHGNYINYYPNNISKFEARKKLGLGKNDFVFLHLGFIRKYKGIEKIIDAFKDLEIENKKLLIVGKILDIKEEKKIKEKIKNLNGVYFFPYFVKEEDMQIFYNASDVVVFSFKDILTSGSVICAMGFKKPLILPYLGCLKEIPKINFFYNFSNKAELKKCMEEAYKNRKILEEIGFKNYMWVSKFDWEKIAKETKRVYKR